MVPEETLLQAETLLAAYRAKGWRIATAESCTGGLIAAALTAIAGSSDVVDRGFVTYSNAAKTELLGVDPALIARVGAVSEDVARAMAAGALQRSKADAAVSVTGVAGPGGGSAEKPVGLVWFGLASKAGVRAECVVFPGDRSQVRAQTVAHALGMLGQA
ncbi:MAG: CinA family protein [Acetobacteraceae bacterium]|nr:CinA family protein [Acetobacteraceae bacterium]